MKPTVDHAQRLRDLVEELMSTLAHTQGEIEATRTHAPKGKYFGPSSDFDWSFSAAMSDPVVEEIANRLLDELGPRNQFEGPDEVILFLVEELGRLSDDERIPDEEMTRRQAEALTRALPRWQFEIGLPADAPVVEAFGTTVEIGGTEQFSIGALQPDRLLLKGQVPASTRHGAVGRAERALDAFLGMARCLGFVELKRSRDPAADGHMYCEIVLTSGEESRNPPSRTRLAALYADRIGASRFIRPLARSEVLGPPQGVIEAAAHPFRLLRCALTAASERAREIRAACRLAMNAEDAAEFGVLITLAFTCLEGLLLKKESKSEVLGRLSEATAHSLGGSFADIDMNRERVRRLYDARSRFAHTGIAIGERRARAEVMDLVHGVLRRQLEQLLLAERGRRPDA